MNNIIATEKNYYKKENDLRFVEVDILQPILKNDTWECTLIMRGYGDVHRALYGQTSMQALSFALQHAKFNLTLMVNDGFNYFDNNENKLLSTQETFELLDAVYGRGTMLDEQHRKTIYLRCINRLQKSIGTDEEQNADIDYLKKEFTDPKIIDYIYHHTPELSALEIYEKAKLYKPIIL
jgi:hypothetical protein